MYFLMAQDGSTAVFRLGKVETFMLNENASYT